MKILDAFLHKVACLHEEPEMIGTDWLNKGQRG
jgi:hypothetical protein